MDTDELKALSNRSRFMREAGVALLLGSLVLSIFLFVPLTPVREEATATIETPPDAYQNVVIEAQAAIVYDLAANDALYVRNEDAQLPLASLTKLLTIEAALHVLSGDMPITLREGDIAVSSPHRFKVGDTLTLRDLARLTLTASLNDGASAIMSALTVREATTTPAALQSAAALLGLQSTYALNSNGLDVSSEIGGGYGSARDMALLAGALLRDAPDIALATTFEKASATTLGGKSYEILNTNPTVLTAPRLLLSKTGFTDLAGGNLVMVFDASIGHPIAVVVLGSTEESRFTDANALIAATLAHFAGIASL